MIPIAITFTIINGLLIFPVKLDMLFIGLFLSGFSGGITSVMYGSFIQGDGTLYIKGSVDRNHSFCPDAWIKY